MSNDTTTHTTEWHVVRDLHDGEPRFRAFETFDAAWAERGDGQVMRIREGRAATADRACAQARWDWGWGSDAEFCTRDGVTLTKQVRMPDAASFHDVFEAFEPWTDDMGARNGGYSEEGRRVRHTYGSSVVSSPYVSVDMGQLGGPRFASMAARPNARVRELLRDAFEISSFKLIAHKSTGRVLVIAQHQFISGGPWIAYIDADTIPGA